MTGTADRTHDVLLRVAEFLRKLPADQIEALANGDAKLEIVGAAKRKPLVDTPALDVDVARVDSDLKGIRDRDAAARYLSDLALKKPALLELAKQLDVPVAAKDTAAKIITTIVEQKVGRRLISDAIFSRR